MSKRDRLPTIDMDLLDRVSGGQQPPRPPERPMCKAPDEMRAVREGAIHGQWAGVIGLNKSIRRV